MSGTELVDRMKAYLEREFPGNEISEEFDASRDIIELRVLEPDGRTLLAEVASSHSAGSDAKEIARNLGPWNLAQAMRDHLRVLLTPDGLEPLPWKQLAADRDVVEITSEESFPASDPPGHSAVTRERRR